MVHEAEAKDDLFEKVLQGELSGKNAAIQSYDGIIWKIRSGYMTLIFASWAILLKAIVENKEASGLNVSSIANTLFVITLGLALGGFLLDTIYSRRKSRVIHALDKLFEEIKVNPDNVRKIPLTYFKISGDNPDIPYLSPGYIENMKASMLLFFTPVVMFFIGMRFCLQL